jgi:anti-sigma B factor antagonist
MHLGERQVNGVSIIDVSGDLRVPAEDPRALRDRVTAALLRGERRILLNFANLQYMDSSCLGEIVESYKSTASNGGTLKLAHIGPHLRNLLHTTTLAKIFEFYDTEDEAIASFGKTAAPVEDGRPRSPSPGQALE